ncbi:hypothetical protein K440DRAFT_644042 [Wilcoxina mikolae CBS 423.85]|nr:hypothetical protein K440DRAFT_644042 [Wilcoxina mikolae CBS 423.85]
MALNQSIEASGNVAFFCIVFARQKYILSEGVSQNLSDEVISLHIVLKETKYLSAEYGKLDAEREADLLQIGNGCHGVLKDLESLVAKYDKLGTQQQRTWDRMRFGLEDLSEIRTRLISHTGMLTALNTSIASASQKLDKFMSEVRAGLREGSVISVQTVDSLPMDKKVLWHGFRRELEDVGISAVVLKERKDFVIAWFQKAVAEGALDETLVSDDKSVEPSNESGETHTPRINDGIEIIPVVPQIELGLSKSVRNSGEVKPSLSNPRRWLRRLFSVG